KRVAALHRGREAVDLKAVAADAGADRLRDGDARIGGLDGLLRLPDGLAAERLRGALERGKLGGDVLERRLQTADVVLAGLDARRGLPLDRHPLLDGVVRLHA